MSATGTAYDTGGPTGVCSATGRALAVGEAYIAALVEVPATDSSEPTLARMDFALEAWAAGARPAPPAALIGFWRSEVPERGKPKSPLAEASEIGELFEHLSEATDPRRLAFRYLLALILVRKRRLVVEGSRRDGEGRSYLLVRWRGAEHKDDPLMDVLDPALDETSVEAMAEELEAVMRPDEDGANA